MKRGVPRGAMVHHAARTRRRAPAGLFDVLLARARARARPPPPRPRCTLPAPAATAAVLFALEAARLGPGVPGGERGVYVTTTPPPVRAPPRACTSDPNRGWNTGNGRECGVCGAVLCSRAAVRRHLRRVHVARIAAELARAGGGGGGGGGGAVVPRVRAPVVRHVRVRVGGRVCPHCGRVFENVAAVLVHLTRALFAGPGVEPLLKQQLVTRLWTGMRARKRRRCALDVPPIYPRAAFRVPAWLVLCARDYKRRLKHRQSSHPCLALLLTAHVDPAAFAAKHEGLYSSWPCPRMAA